MSLINSSFQLENILVFKQSQKKEVCNVPNGGFFNSNIYYHRSACHALAVNPTWFTLSFWQKKYLI